MSKNFTGPSLYYATDKNIFDALNQSKVDMPTVLDLFHRRNIIVGRKTQREELAKYFSRLTHDYYDHKDISNKLGVSPRRERITSMDVAGISDEDDLRYAINELKKELEEAGDVVSITNDNGNLVIKLHYSLIDYKRAEFTQVQNRDGLIEFVKSDHGYVLRCTQNEYVCDVRDSLLGKIKKATPTGIVKTEISLFDIINPTLRSKFFHELASNLPGFTRKDVTDVYVYKSRPLSDGVIDNSVEQVEPDSHVERVLLRGSGITRSELLNDLLDEEEYFIIKIGWTASENFGNGNVYDIEALFADPVNCTGFSFILSGVYPYENGKVLTKRRPPMKSEIESISRVIENKSRSLILEIRNEFNSK